YVEPPLADAVDAVGSPVPLPALTEQMRAGAVDTLVILDANPVYDAPADLAFSGALARVRRTVCLGLYENETAAACQWFVPALHYLERWGDVRAWDGTASIIQQIGRAHLNSSHVNTSYALFCLEKKPVWSLGMGKTI